MIMLVKHEPKTSDQYTAFENLLKRVIRVPHSEIKEKLEAEKRTKKEKRPKTSDASRASGDKD
jgi:predicted GIY-YIG superfamily endonuclease